jgi:hypothetical protein
MPVVSPPADFRPPPNASSQQKVDWHKQMHAWLSEQLDAQNIAAVNAPSSMDFKQFAIWRGTLGNMRPLKELYPELVEFSQPPKRKKGAHKPTDRPFVLAKAAAEMASRIRTLWFRQYRQNRRQIDEWSAEDWAVAICKEWFEATATDLTTDAVLAAAKPSGKHKTRAKPKTRAS